MFERNLGNIERVLRLLTGLFFIGWAITQPLMNGIDWFIATVSLMLILNGIFSRCYLWYILDINTRNTKDSANNINNSCS